MIENKFIRFIILSLIGILGGTLFGLTLAMCVLGVVYGVEFLIVAVVIVSLFYIVSFWRIIKNRKYLVGIRKIAEIALFSTLLNSMFVLEAELIEFNSFDMFVIYICGGFASFIMTTFFILEDFFKDSWLTKEINHIIKGMQIYGLLPEDPKEEEQEEQGK